MSFTCASLAHPSGGTVTATKHGATTSAHYTCVVGYTLDGAYFRECQPGGSWSPADPPTCVYCANIGIPSSGDVKLFSDGLTSQANSTCGLGYHLVGDVTRTCLTSGVWSGTTPACECNDPTQPEHGSVVADGLTANYTCSQGYSLAGSAMRTCQSGGLGWSDSDPTCESCGPPAAQAGINHVLGANGVQTFSDVSCDVGYTLSGDVRVYCNGGVWDTLPTCTCNSPPMPQHSFMTANGSHATYICDVGYSLEGDRVRVCANDGSGWIGTDPECTPCQTISTAVGRMVSLSTDGLETTASFTCTVGYTLNGQGNITCRSDGSWDFSEPVCETCPILNVPTSGDVTMTTDTMTTKATFSCLPGYFLSGTETITCLTSGCVAPSAPLQGSVEIDDNSFGQYANYTCNLGYVISALGTRRCMDDGTGWEATDPTCERCTSLSNPTGGSVAQSTDGQTTTANYTCVVGYSLKGSNIRVCQVDTSWQPLAPTCAYCSNPGTPASGSVDLTTDGVTSVVTYSCATGYTLKGAATRVCLTTGVWDGLTPTCECEVPATPLHGTMVSDGKTANYTCDVGYALQGHIIRTCSVAGTGWSDTDPVCTQCSPLAAPNGGSYTLNSTGTQTFALFTCEKGYTMSAMCHPLLTPDSGTVDLASTGYATLAKYACALGYTLAGARQRVCQVDGSWDLETPSCYCNSPTVPQHGSMTANDSHATYTCGVGYSLQGDHLRVCANDGSGWSGADPECTTCLTISIPSGGAVILDTDGVETSASFTCIQGYTLNGHVTITCRGDGTWNFSPPQCVSCPTLSSPASGNVSLTSNTLVTMATFACDADYYLSGQRTATCTSAGQWSNPSPTCKCNSPGAPLHGSMYITETSGFQVANYGCALGYSISGLTQRRCLDDASGWEDVDPSCTSCDTITTTPELTVVKSTNGSSTRALYACALNYTLSGEHVHTCTSTGVWNHQKPICVLCSTKYDPPSGSVTLSTDGLVTSASFRCVTGYSTNSTTVTLCGTDGDWDLPNPFCVCDPPKAIINGGYVLMHGEMAVNYTCDSGYELVGGGFRLCSTDGTGWNGTDPRCAAGSHFNTVNPDVTNSKSLLLNEESDKNTKTTFNAKSLHGRALSTPSVDKNNGAIVENSAPEMLAVNLPEYVGTPARKIPLAAVRLPALSPRTAPEKLPKSPTKSTPTKSPSKTGKTRRKRRRKDEERKPLRPPTDTSASNGSLSLPETTTSTPIEIQLGRGDTPIMLQSDNLDYIQRVYCHEMDTPLPSRPVSGVEQSRTLSAIQRMMNRTSSTESSV
ncbi:SVEP1-like protein [Mya arenaria]|uniref:SVEP1-like protein n=1 Tax=Mya arenaria TaxID=6604 RepID=A0ABY7DNB5_MYAAR|nr:SVEP1-like protein [Mya arenaria]